MSVGKLMIWAVVGMSVLWFTAWMFATVAPYIMLMILAFFAWVLIKRWWHNRREPRNRIVDLTWVQEFREKNPDCPISDQQLLSWFCQAAEFAATKVEKAP